MNHQEVQNRSQRPFLFPKAVPVPCSRLLTRCLSHLRLWEREVPNTGSSLDHGNTALLESSRSKRSKAPSPDGGFHTCTSLRSRELGKAQPESLLTPWQRHHLFPCQPEQGAGSAGRAGIPQQLTFLPRRLSSSKLHASSTTTPLSQDPTDPCETDGKRKSVALSRFSSRLLCFLAPQSSVRAGEVIF